MKTKASFWLIVFGALVFCFMTTSAHADVMYTFTGINNGPGGDGLAVGFQYTSPIFLTATPPPFSGTVIPGSQLDSCTACLVSSSIAVGFTPNNNGFGDTIEFADVNNLESVFAFSLGAFANPGTYHSTVPFNTGTLTVTIVPEPGSLFLSLLGMGTIFGFVMWYSRSRSSRVLIPTSAQS